MSVEMDKPTVTEDAERAVIRKRLENRREFGSHLVTYIVVNTVIVGIWAVTGLGYFWPAWVLGGWGVGLILHGWEAYFHRPVTEADVDAEIRRHRPHA